MINIYTNNTMTLHSDFNELRSLKANKVTGAEVFWGNVNFFVATFKCQTVLAGEFLNLC